MQFVAHPGDASVLYRQLRAYFPEALFQEGKDGLLSAWESGEGTEALVVEFGLAREFMFSLATGKLDPFIGIVGALSDLRANEFGLFQVLFQAAHKPWADSIIRSVTCDGRKAFFVNVPELVNAAEEKVKHPLFAAVVRIAVSAASPRRLSQLACDMAASLRVFDSPQGNELIPLNNTDYAGDEHIQDALCRQSRRTGMLLTSDELIGFVHLPSSAVRSEVLTRNIARSKSAPAIARSSSGLLLGDNIHNGVKTAVRLTPNQRVQHMHIIGASGTGKSTLLFNLLRQDIENGEGVALLDPHGDLVDKVLGIIPEARIDDVILIDPSDEEYSVGFNILSAHSDLEKTLLASDLVSIFQRLSTSWGDQMNSVLQNAILAFLESSLTGTLSDLRRFLLEPAYRSEFLKSVRDSELLYYWQKAFPQLVGNRSVGPIITRLDTFLAPKPIRYMVSQAKNRLDFADIMDSGKIFLAKLPQGLLGKENSYLLGALLVGKFQQLAMARQAKQTAARRDFWIFIDEFHQFITPSMAQILSGARKYRIGLTLAHQELQQLERNRDVASAVMSNPSTRIVFRVGDADAKKLAEGFSYFEAKDLQNLETGQAIARVERADFDFNLSVPFPVGANRLDAAAIRDKIITGSREKYASPRVEVEVALQAKVEPQTKRPSKTTSLAAPLSPKVSQTDPLVSDSGLQKQTEPKGHSVSSEPTPKEPAASPAASRADDVKPLRDTPPVRDLGRGGVQHKAIQKRIKEAAERLGFRSTIEKEILSGRGSIDLFLERRPQTIACEISISTTVDHEVGNVEKCVKEKIPSVVVICIDEDRVRRISAAVVGSLGEEVASNVLYFMPDAFIAHLESLPHENSPETAIPSIRRGYKIRRSVSGLTSAERRAQEEITIRTIAESMQRSKKKKGE